MLIKFKRKKKLLIYEVRVSCSLVSWETTLKTNRISRKWWWSIVCLCCADRFTLSGSWWYAFSLIWLRLFLSVFCFREKERQSRLANTIVYYVQYFINASARFCKVLFFSFLCCCFETNTHKKAPRRLERLVYSSKLEAINTQKKRRGEEKRWMG